jgi:hypothetical protein
VALTAIAIDGTATALALTSTPPLTATPAPGMGVLQICKQLTAAALAEATFTFTSPPGGPIIPNITVPANTTGPVCVTATGSFPPVGNGLPIGTVSVTETVPSGFTLTNATGGTLSGNTVTATIASGQTTTVTFTNTATTGAPGTLVVCKQVVFSGPLGVNPLQAQSNTFTFTTSPVVTIQPITVPAGSTASVCAPGAPIAPGTVTITENVPAGFVLASATGGTLSGNAVTTTVTAGTTTTVTFVNDPAAVLPLLPPTAPSLPSPLPALPLPPPPPPLQALVPPPPALYPPPPAPPSERAAFPEVPVIPEAENWVLLGAGLAALVVLAALCRRRRD